MALTFRQKESYAMSRLPPLTSDSTNEYSSEEDGEDVHLRLNHDEEVSEKLVNLSSCATGKLISDAEDEEEILFQKNPDLNFNNNISAKWTSKSATWGQSFRDWSNVFKAFIGSNYLGMPYAFAQSGVIAGCFGLLFIAGLTGHCCDLIVRCKKICVSRATEVAERAMQKECNGSVSENDLLTDVARKQRVKERAEKSITYGHVGRYA